MTINSRQAALYKTNSIDLTVLNTATTSDWMVLPASTSKLLSLKCPSNTPNTTITFHVRDRETPATVYPVAAAATIAGLLTITANGLGAFGPAALEPLSGYMGGFHEVRITLGLAITGDGIFTLSSPNTTTE